MSDIKNQPALQSPEFRLHEIAIRKAEIEATLARWKNDFFTNGISRSKADRTALEAEYSNLKLESQQNFLDAKKARAERKKKENESLLNKIKEVLRERGLEDVINEANKRAELVNGGASCAK
jgi:hypothetical protein